MGRLRRALLTGKPRSARCHRRLGRVAEPSAASATRRIRSKNTACSSAASGARNTWFIRAMRTPSLRWTRRPSSVSRSRDRRPSCGSRTLSSSPRRPSRLTTSAMVDRSRPTRSPTVRWSSPGSATRALRTAYCGEVVSSRPSCSTAGSAPAAAAGPDGRGGWPDRPLPCALPVVTFVGALTIHGIEHRHPRTPHAICLGLCGS